MKEEMTKGTLGFKIPEVCEKPCLKHYDVSCCVVTYPLKVVCIKRNTEALCTHGYSVPIQEAKKLLSGEVLISLLTGNRNDKKNSMRPGENGMLIKKYSATHSKSGIKCKLFDIDYYSSFHKNPHTVPQVSHWMTADILPKICTLNNGRKPLVPNMPYLIFADLQLWLHALIKLDFVFLSSHNNFPTLTSALLLSISIKKFVSKLMTLKSSHFACSVISFLQSKCIEHSQMDFSDLQFQNDWLLNCCFLRVKKIASNLFKKLIFSSLHLLFALYFEITYTKPLNMGIRLIDQAHELSFIVVSLHHSSSMRFNIVFIPTLDMSSNITNFHIIVEEYSAVQIRRQDVKNLSKQKSWSVLSSYFHKHGSAWNPELCKIILMCRAKLNHMASNSSATLQFICCFAASMTLSSQIFFPCSDTCDGIKSNLNVIPFAPFQVATETDINISSESLNSFKNNLIINLVYNEMVETEMLSSQNSEVFQKNVLNLKSSFKEYRPKEKGLLSEVNVVSIKNNLNTRLVGFQMTARKNISVSEKTINTIKKFFDIFHDIEEIEILSPTKSEALQNDVPNLGSNSEEHQKWKESSETSTIFIVNNSIIKPPFAGFQTAAGKCIRFSKESFNDVKNKSLHLFPDGVVETEILSLKKFVPFQKVLLDSEENIKNKDQLSEKYSAISIDKSFNKIASIGFQTAAGKKVSISDKAINAVKNKFSDLISNKIVETEMLSLINSDQKILLSSRSSSKENQNVNNCLSENDNGISIKDNLNKTLFIGFQTAAGEKINVSKKAVNDVKNILPGIFNDMVETQALCSTNSDPLPKTSRLNYNDNLKEADHLAEKMSGILTRNTLNKTSYFNFQRDVEKKMSVSDEALNFIKGKFLPIIGNKVTSYVTPPLQEVLSKPSSEYSSGENSLLEKKTNAISVEDNLTPQIISLKTLSGKRISVSEKTTNAVKRKFSDLIYDEITERETFSSTYTKLQNVLLSSLSTSTAFPKTNNQLPEEAKSISGKDNLNKKYLGFQTAAGKDINVSEKAINNITNKFSDILNEMVETEILSINSDPLQKILRSNSENHLKETNNLAEKTCGILTGKSRNKTSYFCFQTAVGKKIGVSDEALNSESKFLDIVGNKVTSYVTSQPLQKVLSQPISEIPMGENSSFEKKTNAISIEDNLKTRIIDLQTVPGKRISVSEKTTNVAKRKFSDVISDEMIENETLSSTCTELTQKALFNTLLTSKELPKINSHLPEETNSISDEDNLNKTFLCFQTAAGKSVKVSEKSLNVTKRKFSDIFDTELMEFEKLDIKTMEVLNLKSSCDNLLKENISMSEVFTSVFAESNLRPIKFQTAAGKNINISKKASDVVKARFSNKFMDEQGSFINEVENLLPVSIISKCPDLEQKVNCKNFLGVENPLCKNRNLSFIHENSPKSAFMGFQTAAGKNIQVSEENLNLVKRNFMNLFDGEVKDDRGINSMDYKLVQKELSVTLSPDNNAYKKDSLSFVKSNLNSNEIVGFSTAAGKNIDVSEKALSYVKSKFSNISDTDNFNNSGEKLPSAAFESASMKHLTSCCTFEKGPKRQQFCDVSLTSLSKNDVIGFQTVVGKNISTSESTLNAVKRKFSDLLNEETAQPITSNSVIKSLLNCEYSLETDLKKKRLCTKSDSFLVENLSVDFQTAAGKPVDISDEALNAVKKKFSHAICDCVIENESLTNSNFFQKFQNLNSDLENGANRKLLYSTNVSYIESHENIFNGTGRFPGKNRNVLDITAKQKIIHTPFNEITGKSVLADSRILNSNTTFKRRKICRSNRIEILDFDYCKCFPCGKASPNFSPYSNKNSLSECSFICPDCHKPCKLATIRFVHKKPSFYNLLHANFIHGKVNKKLYPIITHKLHYKRSNHFSGERYKIDNLPLSNTITVINKKVIEDIQHGNIIFQVEKLREKQVHRISIKGHVKIIPGQLTILKRGQHKPTRLRNLTNKSPPGVYTSKQLLSFGVKQHALEVNSMTAENFVFEEEDFQEYTSTSPYCFTIGDSALVILDDSKCAGKKEFFSAFLDSPGVDPSLISDKWFYNHYRWIVWKLASLEFSFPSFFGGNYLTPHHVMLQMKFRYDYEVDSSKRSVLKRIVERDDTPSKTLVLFVSSILKCETEKSENKESIKNMFQVKLSDGWYEICAKIDSAMENLIKKNKVDVGSKIITSGAELCGSDVAYSPLEIPDCLHLRIHTNSTRITRWDVKLGYFPHRRPFAVPVSSIIPDGGCIGHIRIVVSRVYPILYLEKYENRSQITRNEKMEFKIQEQYQNLQEHHLNRIRKSVYQTFEEHPEEKNITRKQSSCKYKLLTGEELFEALNSAVDIQAFLESLDMHQISILKEFEKKHMERKYFQMEEAISNAIAEAKNVGECLVDRNVTPVLKIFVKGCHILDHHSNIDVILNIWRPSSDMLELLTEGTALGIFYLYPSRYQNDVIHLNSMKITCYEKISLERTLMKNVYQPRKVTELGDIAKHFNNAIIDIIGFIFHVTDSSEDVKSKDMIYVTNAKFNSLVIKFPHGFSSTGCQDLLTVGNVIAVCNLKLDMNPNDFPVCSTATLVTTFSCSPKANYLNEAMQNLKQQIKDPMQFIKQAKDVLESKFETRSNKSKYSFNSNYIDSSAKRHRSKNIASNVIYNEMLGRLDNVTIQQSPFLSKCLPEKLFTSVKERLLNLESLPSPPPLPRLTINSSLSARTNFKSPK